MSGSKAASEVRIAKAIGYRIIAQKAVRAVLWLIVIAAVVYAVIAGTMIRYVATDIGVLKIASPNFPGGHAPIGTAVAIDPAGGHDGNPLKNIATAFTPHSGILVGEVVQGPYGAVDWKAYGFDGVEKDKKLSSQYIIRCIEGCSVVDGYGLITADQILGVPIREEQQ